MGVNTALSVKQLQFCTAERSAMALGENPFSHGMVVWWWWDGGSQEHLHGGDETLPCLGMRAFQYVHGYNEQGKLAAWQCAGLACPWRTDDDGIVA